MEIVGVILLLVLVYLIYNQIERVNEEKRLQEFEAEKRALEAERQRKLTLLLAQQVKEEDEEPEYVSHCFSCHEPVNSNDNIQCKVCGYYVCNEPYCGVCFCDWQS